MKVRPRPTCPNVPIRWVEWGLIELLLVGEPSFKSFCLGRDAGLSWTGVALTALAIGQVAISETFADAVRAALGHMPQLPTKQDYDAVLARLKAANPALRVVLTGCSVREPDRDGLQRRYPAVDLFLRPDEEPELVARLGLAGQPVELAAETCVEDIVATLSQGARPALPSALSETGILHSATNVALAARRNPEGLSVASAPPALRVIR